MKSESLTTFFAKYALPSIKKTSHTKDSKKGAKILKDLSEEEIDETKDESESICESKGQISIIPSNSGLAPLILD